MSALLTKYRNRMVLPTPAAAATAVTVSSSNPFSRYRTMACVWIECAEETIGRPGRRRSGFNTRAFPPPGTISVLSTVTLVRPGTLRLAGPLPTGGAEALTLLEHYVPACASRWGNDMA